MITNYFTNIQPEFVAMESLFILIWSYEATKCHGSIF